MMNQEENLLLEQTRYSEATDEPGENENLTQ